MTPALAALVAELGLDIHVARDATSVDLRAVHHECVLAIVSVRRRAGYDRDEAEDDACDALVRELARLIARAEQLGVRGRGGAPS